MRLGEGIKAFPLTGSLFKSATLRAYIRIGEISRELEKAPGDGGYNRKARPSGGKSQKSATLRAAGISTATAHRAEQLAAVATPLQIAAPGASCAVDVGKENAPLRGRSRRPAARSIGQSRPRLKRPPRIRRHRAGGHPVP